MTQDSDNLDALIKQAQEKGLLEICPLRLSGRASVVFSLMGILAKTEPMETDSSWWQLRLWLARN